MKKASPSPQEGEKVPTNRLFSRGTRQAPTLAAPLRAPMSECDYKIHNIYSTLIYIKIHSRMHPIDLLKKNSQKSIPSNPLAMKLNSAVYAPYERQRKRDVLQYLPLSKKISPQCLNIDLYPPSSPPDNDRVCDHNALLAFPQEKISHYTTEYKIKKLFIYIMINYILSSYKNYRAGLNKGIALMNGVGCGYGVKLG